MVVENFRVENKVLQGLKNLSTYSSPSTTTATTKKGIRNYIKKELIRKKPTKISTKRWLLS